MFVFKEMVKVTIASLVIVTCSSAIAADEHRWQAVAYTDDGEYIVVKNSNRAHATVVVQHFCKIDYKKFCHLGVITPVGWEIHIGIEPGINRPFTFYISPAGEVVGDSRYPKDAWVIEAAVIH